MFVLYLYKWVLNDKGMIMPSTKSKKNSSSENFLFKKRSNQPFDIYK